MNKIIKTFGIAIIILLIIIGSSVIAFELAKENYVEITPQKIVTRDEFKCYEFCEGKTYFYEPKTTFKQTVCICGESLK